eukprot:CAMPEP_0184870210 /NCGR_PEP_ID=MMETSP0580-20130426/36849_1 /TAXON_ID=1118495 /ORGANISM="Dactyliosolen fragilissimus" /LENGTH=39 /DNA_ID= /DNA_START= /DNA_END= /DNA_ORIENTATION=
MTQKTNGLIVLRLLCKKNDHPTEHFEMLNQSLGEKKDAL